MHCRRLRMYKHSATMRASSHVHATDERHALHAATCITQSRGPLAHFDE